MKHKILVILPLILIMLLLPLTQPIVPMATGRCRTIAIDTLDENGRIVQHSKELCCRYEGRLYCILIEEWPEEADG